MGYFAGNMVDNMSLRDTVGSVTADPAHQLAAVAHQAAIERSQSTARECKFWSPVVGEKGICMLQEGNHDQPVVYPVKSHWHEIGNDTVEAYQR